jgi:geranylgeranyl diphosphate synthase type I
VTDAAGEIARNLRAVADVRDRVDALLVEVLSDRRAELAGMDPAAATLADELLRVVSSGGKRIRPALCSWAHRATGGSDGPVIDRVAAGLELLHTFALIHDDVMDATDERRGVDSTRARFAKEAPPGTDPDRYGDAMAVLVGDLAAVLAERLVRTCGAPPSALGLVLERFDRMRMEMAAGQLLDLATPGAASPRVAALKTTAYTVEGPVLIGAALAGAAPERERPLRVYARLVGEAFQLRDDVLDGEASTASARRLDDLVDRAGLALEGAPLDVDACDVLRELAESLRLGRG